MSNNDIQQQTTVNIQEKANLIWAIADIIRKTICSTIVKTKRYLFLNVN